MKTIDQIKHKLHTDPDSSISWMAGGFLPPAVYDTEEISGIQISLMLEGYEDVYVLLIIPNLDGEYDAWVRRYGCSDMVHMLSKRARDPEDVVVAAKECLPDYIGLI